MSMRIRENVWNRQTSAVKHVQLLDSLRLVTSVTFRCIAKVSVFRVCSYPVSLHRHVGGGLIQSVDQKPRRVP